MPTRRPLIDRFAAKIQLDPGTGCWLWTACLSEDGYGVIGLNGKTIYAHQASWLMFRGDLVPGLELDHFHCGCRSCVNPYHLRLATDKQQCETRGPKQVCRHGHRYDEVGFFMRIGRNPDGTPYQYRKCKICQQAEWKKLNHKRRLANAERASQPQNR